MPKRILFVNQEIIPYVPGTPVADMGKMLPHNMQEAGYEIRTFMPKWGEINERRGQLHEVIRLSGMNIVIDETDHPLVIKVASIPATRIQVYFIDNEDYFAGRGMTCDTDGTPYADNGERAIFFARGVIETVKKLRWNPDIIQCQGWMTALLPFYARTAYKNEPAFANAKIVSSVFAGMPEGSLGKNFKSLISFHSPNSKDGRADKKALAAYPDEFDYNTLARLATDFSDGVVEAGLPIDATLAEHLRAHKHFLANPGADFAPAYNAFYESLLAEGEAEQ